MRSASTARHFFSLPLFPVQEIQSALMGAFVFFGHTLFLDAF